MEKHAPAIGLEVIVDPASPDPEASLPERVRDQRRRARWGFGQLRWRFQEGRIAASIGYQAAKAGWRETRAISREGWKTDHTLLRLEGDADRDDQLNLELVSQDWRRYSEMHAALAENGASVAVTTVDKIFRQFC